MSNLNSLKFDVKRFENTVFFLCRSPQIFLCFLTYQISCCFSPTGGSGHQGFQVRNHDMFQAYQRRKTLRGNRQQRYAATNFVS